MEKRKRIDLRVRLENTSEAEALIKIQNYDKEKYNSMSDYILHAVLAYAEPMEVCPESFMEELRMLMREELVLCKMFGGKRYEALESIYGGRIQHISYRMCKWVC